MKKSVPRPLTLHAYTDHRLHARPGAAGPPRAIASGSGFTEPTPRGSTRPGVGGHLPSPLRTSPVAPVRTESSWGSGGGCDAAIVSWSGPPAEPSGQRCGASHRCEQEHGHRSRLLDALGVVGTVPR